MGVGHGRMAWAEGVEIGRACKPWVFSTRRAWRRAYRHGRRAWAYSMDIPLGRRSGIGHGVGYGGRAWVKGMDIGHGLRAWL